jgi:hypothetical protein
MPRAKYAIRVKPSQQRKLLFVSEAVWHVTLETAGKAFGDKPEVMFSSETYYSKPNAMRAARTLSRITGVNIEDLGN